MWPVIYTMAYVFFTSCKCVNSQQKVVDYSCSGFKYNKQPSRLQSADPDVDRSAAAIEAVDR